MMTKKAQAAEISQLVDEMVQKGAKMAQTERKSRHFKKLVKRSREKAKAFHGHRADDTRLSDFACANHEW